MFNRIITLLKPKQNTIFIFILMLFVLQIQAYAEIDDSWQADSPQIQLEKEGRDDQVGLGRLFVPKMTTSELEPPYKIFQNGKVVKTDCKTGESVFLDPGKYEVVLGSSEIDKYKIKKEVTIENQGTHILPVTWSGLIIKIIDRNRNFLREPYEIYRLGDYDAGLGVEYSADEDEPDERQQTWLLPSGYYKIIKYKESPKTFVNFTTVQLDKGKLVVVTIVMDSSERTFVGSGVLPELSQKLKAKNWTRYTSLDASFNLTSNNATEQDEHIYNANLIANPENNFKLDKFPYYFNSDQKLLIGFNKETNQDLKVNTNSLQINATFIYYLLKSIGVYSRIRFDGSMLPTNYYFESAQDTVYKVSKDGIIDTLFNVDKVEITPAVFPVKFEEGFGLSLRILNSPAQDLKFNTGFGLSQNINSDVYEQDKNNKNLFNELETIYLSGLEASLSGDFQFAGNLTYVIELYTLYPFDEDRTQSYRFENSISLRITSIFSLDYSLNLEKGETKDWLVQNHNLSLNVTFISF